jgi:hypothetical protein
MTRDEIIEMARQAGIPNANIPSLAFGQVETGLKLLEAFAKLVAAKEREACAKMADEYATWGGSNFYDWFKKLAVAIRARGEQA